MKLLSILILFIAIVNTNAFNTFQSTSYRPFNKLYMGRAAAVRANTKARTDGAKAKTYNRFAKAIINVVKAGGPDPVVNRNLAVVLADAKAANVPNDVIKRNIDKASSSATAAFKESLFEFIGPGGSYILVNVQTDNDNRASSDVNLVGKKQILKSGSKGSVLFNFHKKARLDITGLIDEDKLMELCIENDINDYELRNQANGNPNDPSIEGNSVVYVDLKDMAVTRDCLRNNGYVLETSIFHIPKEGYIELNDNDFNQNIIAIDAFLALDDVDSVEHNINLIDSE